MVAKVAAIAAWGAILAASAVAQTPERAAEMDAATAEVVGFDLLLGRGGVSRDPARAAVSLEHAAAAGLPNAAAALASMYQYGVGVPRDEARALDLAAQAAQHGVASALAMIGAERAYGRPDMPRDPAAGVHWLKAAAEQGEPLALFILGQLYRYGDGADRDEDLGRQLVMRSAELGYAPAGMEASAFLLRGEPAPADVAKAIHFARFAAASNYAPAAYRLAKLYLVGRHVERDPAQAVQWLTRASDLGLGAATLWLSELYAKGIGVPSDERRAAELRDGALSGLSLAERNQIAWELAVNTEVTLRNGALAVEIMEAVPLSELAAHHVDTLAAAYAAAGRFDEAVQTQLRALAVWPATAPEATRASLEARLSLYRDGQSYSEEL